MSIKSKSRRLGRMIRRTTGIPLPIAMSIGKGVIQNKYASELKAKFPDHIKMKSMQAGDCTCCAGLYEMVIFGPKGELEGDTEDKLIKDYKIGEKLKAVPMGTAVSLGEADTLAFKGDAKLLLI